MTGGCQCPKINLEEWRDREISLAGHRFLAAPTPVFLHVPRRLYRDLEALQTKIEQGGYRGVDGPLVLHRDGWFRGEVLLSVDPQTGERPEVRAFQNLFYSRVVEQPGFDAALREMPRFYRDLARAGVGKIEAMYFWYLSCPRCLIERGAGQIILLGRSNRLLAAAPCPMETAGLALPCGT
jgi:hypothetical protein